MARTVSVRLEAQVKEFIAGLKSADKATTEVEKSIEASALAAEASGKAIDGLGGDFRDTAGDARKLKNEIQDVEKSLAALAMEYAAASSVIDRNRISEDITSKRKEHRELLSVDDLLPKPAEIKAAGNKAGKQLGTSIGEALSSAPTWAPFAAAAAPLLGATISAAVIGGAGVGGVVGGVLLAAKDPRVAAAGTEMAHSLLGQLEKDAAPFVEPTLLGIAKIEGAFKAMDGEIKHIFSVSSGFLGPLEDGVIGAVGGILDGVDALVTKGKPVIDQLGHSFTELGHATGDALKTISGGADDAAVGLKDLTDTVSITIRGAGYLVRGLTELYGPVTQLPRMWKDAQLSLLGWNDTAKTTSIAATVAGTAQRALAGQMMSASEAAGKAGLNMITYGQSMDEAASKGRGLYDSQTAVADAVANTRKALKDNSATLDLNTAKGRANRNALSSLAGALVANYDAYVKVNGEGLAAGRVAEHNRSQFVSLARQFGLGSVAANHLADSMGLIKPKSVDVHVNTHDAAARVAALNGQIASLHGKTITVTTVLRTNNAGDQALHGHRAAGGPVKKGLAYIVGEKRPEVFVPDRDGTIIPSISDYGSVYGTDNGSYGSPWGAHAPAPVWQSSPAVTTVSAPTTVNLTITAPVGSHPREIGATVVDYIGSYLQGGGELRINGKRLLGA